MNKNFYISGTLRENLIRKVYVEDSDVHKLIHDLHIDEDIDDYDQHGLDARVHF